MQTITHGSYLAAQAAECMKVGLSVDEALAIGCRVAAMRADSDGQVDDGHTLHVRAASLLDALRATPTPPPFWYLPTQ